MQWSKIKRKRKLLGYLVPLYLNYLWNSDEILNGQKDPMVTIGSLISENLKLSSRDIKLSMWLRIEIWLCFSGRTRLRACVECIISVSWMGHLISSFWWVPYIQTLKWRTFKDVNVPLDAAVVLLYCSRYCTVILKLFSLFLFFMYYLCEKYYKFIIVQYYIAICVSWVPRLTLLDLQTNGT